MQCLTSFGQSIENFIIYNYIYIFIKHVIFWNDTILYSHVAYTPVSSDTRCEFVLIPRHIFCFCFLSFVMKCFCDESLCNDNLDVEWVTWRTCGLQKILFQQAPEKPNVICHPSASSLAPCQALNSKLPHWLITLSTPLSQLTATLFLATTPRHVLYAPPTPICCRFLKSTQPLLPVVSALLPPQYGTHSLLAFTLVLHHIHSVVFLKPTVSSRPSVSPSGSHKCLGWHCAP